ncbi:MAG: PQQ-binding-like beta-propeller repeat protein [Tepidisphaeraceae bacterium]
MRNFVAAVDLGSGKVRWTTKVKLPPSQITCDPEGREAYFCTNLIGFGEGSVYAVDPATGRARWEQKLKSLHAMSAVTLAGDHVLVPCAGQLLALRRSDGKLAWAVTMDRSVHPMIALGTDGATAYAAGSASGEVIAVGVTSGRTLWRTRAGSMGVAGVGFAAGRLLVARAYEPLLVLELGGGTPVREVKSEASTDCASDGHFAFFEADYDGEDLSKVVCLDAKTLRTKWTWKIDLKKRKPPHGFVPALVTAERVYVAAHHGDVIALDREAGKPVWELSNAGDMLAGYRFPTRYGDRVLVYARSGEASELLAIPR